MSKIEFRFLLYTFAIMILCWGVCWITSAYGITMQYNPWLYLFFILGGWSPTIASYIILKQSKCVAGLKDWLRSLFPLRTQVRNYGMIAAFIAAFFAPQCLISGYEQGAPLFAVIFMLPMMLLGGGLEEAGWRYILQPELEKKYGFAFATIIVSAIWWLWHLPLFYIQGVSQYGGDYLAFGVNVLGLSFGLAAIYKRTKNIWLCILFHCLINSLSGVYLVKDGILGNVASAFVMVLMSLLWVQMGNDKEL